MSSEAVASRDQGLVLFLVGFLVLFLELASIRWFAAYVVFLQYFTNVVLIAAFLGMSCGCMAARSKRDWLGAFPVLALIAVGAAMALFVVYNLWSGLAIDVGHQNDPQRVFFGAEYRSPDLAQFVIPLEWVAGLFFILVAMMFVGLGQALGRAFDAHPGRVMAYTWNILGSLAGIAGFSLLSFLQSPPVVWFAIIVAGVAFLLARAGSLSVFRVVALATLVGVIATPMFSTPRTVETRWSPYYDITYHKDSRYLVANAIGHQWIDPFNEKGAAYSLIHLLQKHSGGAPFDNVLIIGAGTGNDVDRALRAGARHIDAVEIDPAINAIGVRENPDHPFQDPRVHRIIDDGRHFLRTTTHKYDLVIYARVDSLVLHSSYANLSLESYLFTDQAFGDVRRVLAPGGTFVMYNYFRQGWIVERIAAMAQRTFGCAPMVISLPYRATLATDETSGYSVIIAGCNPAISAAFAQHKTFWLNAHPPTNLGIDGFSIDPAKLPPGAAGDFQPIGLTRLVHDGGPVFAASDDWPFLYLRGRLIPDFTLRSMALLGVLGIGMVWLFLPKGKVGLHSRMFFLGAAFMLLETRAVVQMALLFGSTWVVNSAVFFTALILILLANLYVLRVRTVSLTWAYIGLFATLALATFLPASLFLSGGVVMRYAIPCLLALGPMAFSGVIFAVTFKDAPDPDLAFGSNIAGSVLGGLAESLSMILGFQHLLLVAMVLYALSAWTPRLAARKALATA